MKLADILTSQPLREEIIQSYNSYFAGNPYKEWFGHNRDNSYKVEGFLRGLRALYFDVNTVPLQGIHIDLFPFATVDDFGAIKETVYAAPFADGWAQRLVSRLIECFLRDF